MIIEISSDKFSELHEDVEKMLHYGSKVMECIEGFQYGSSIGERRGFDSRDGGRYNSRGMRYQERDDDDWDDDFGEHRSRSRSTGRYIRR